MPSTPPADQRWMKHVPDALLLVLAGCLICFNLAGLAKEIRKITLARKVVPYVFIGLKFAGLQPYLHDAKYIGYYTDKNLDNLVDAMQFAQAQYIMTPTVLDLNNTDHDYVIFDCADLNKAVEKITELNLIPLARNQFGIILAKKAGRP